MAEGEVKLLDQMLTEYIHTHRLWVKTGRGAGYWCAVRRYEIRGPADWKVETECDGAADGYGHFFAASSVNGARQKKMRLCVTCRKLVEKAARDLAAKRD